MSKAGRKFGARLYSEIEAARPIEGDAIPTPPENWIRNVYIREAAAGQRSSRWVEEDDPMSESHRQMNEFLRSARPAEE